MTPPWNREQPEAIERTDSGTRSALASNTFGKEGCRNFSPCRDSRDKELLCRGWSMLEPLSPSHTFEQCVQALAHALQVDVQPRTHEDRLLLVHYFAALVISGRLSARAHDGLGNTAMHYAARIGWAAGVDSIFSSRALEDDEASDRVWGSEELQRDQAHDAAAAVLRKNTSGCSALHCACVSGCLRTLHTLLQIAGDAPDDAGTADAGSTGVARDRAAIDNESRTLLHYAGMIRAEVGEIKR